MTDVNAAGVAGGTRGREKRCLMFERDMIDAERKAA